MTRVALETAFLTTGLPEDARLPTAEAMARAVAGQGAQPAFVGVSAGGAGGRDRSSLARAAFTRGRQGLDPRPELGRTPVVLVCSGAKAILDLPATLERLETLGPWIGAGLKLDGVAA